MEFWVNMDSPNWRMRLFEAVSLYFAYRWAPSSNKLKKWNIFSLDKCHFLVLSFEVYLVTWSSLNDNALNSESNAMKLQFLMLSSILGKISLKFSLVTSHMIQFSWKKNFVKIFGHVFILNSENCEFCYEIAQPITKLRL